jgi:hypothetical protein
VNDGDPVILDAKVLLEGVRHEHNHFEPAGEDVIEAVVVLLRQEVRAAMAGEAKLEDTQSTKRSTQARALFSAHDVTYLHASLECSARIGTTLQIQKRSNDGDLVGQRRVVWRLQNGR